ncbi:MAG TPA: delta-60 repeat domain-containing protein, partial [Casimicrobium sp.]|nr:delta-60 repeat domain-containing protein [Casimicrobium sp.]
MHTSPFPGFNGGTGKITNLAIGAGNDYGTAIALQSDGKIVLVGRCTNGADMDFCVARVLPDGTLDSSFDGPSGVGN